MNHRNEIIKLFSLNLIYNAIQSKEIFYHKILNSNLLQKIIILNNDFESKKIVLESLEITLSILINVIYIN